VKSAVALLLVALLQCYATRTRSGCEQLSFHASLAECGPLARRYQREDNRALTVTRLPAVVHYRCIILG
jgi:hypothetical protein